MDCSDNTELSGGATRGGSEYTECRLYCQFLREDISELPKGHKRAT